MARIKFKVSAKTDVGLVRTNNEDNYQISRDLQIEPMRWVNNEMCQLGDLGCLLAVADGMGGANAGEVASQVAMDTIKEEFSPQKLKGVKTTSSDAINAYLRSVIEIADANIKKYAKSHPETKGMGTTIVIAWLIGDKLYIGWCGDSRAYIFNSTYGLIRLSKDHSYVQQLVDSGKLSDDEAFDFPDSNIITRCLSDSEQKALPDTLESPVTVSNGDIILLCTDGLCGMIKDSVISSVISASSDNISDLSNDLVSAALKASGSDNVTVALCKICSGARIAPQSLFPSKTNAHKKNRNVVFLIVLVCFVLIGLSSWWALTSSKSPLITQEEVQPIISSDSIKVVPPQGGGVKDGVVDAKQETPSDLEKEYIAPSASSILDGIKKENVQIPETNAEKESTNEEPTAPSTIVVVVPEGLTIRAFMREYEMDATDFKSLNPEIKIDSIKPGMKVKVYNKEKSK